MSNYQIMRVEKVKTAGALATAVQHNLRLRETPNADRSRSVDNLYLSGQSTEAILGKMREIHASLDRTPRKDAVIAGQYLVTASPEKMRSMPKGEQHRYFSAALDWIRERHGAENVLSAAIHMDEATPHMHVLFVPVTDRNTLSFKQFFGGKEKLRELQTEFHREVSREFGMDRGVERSRAKHQTIQRYYAHTEYADRAVDVSFVRPPNNLTRMPDRQELKAIKRKFKCSEKEALVRFGDALSRQMDAAHIEEMTGVVRRLKDDSARGSEWEGAALRLGSRVKTISQLPEDQQRSALDDLVQKKFFERVKSDQEREQEAAAEQTRPQNRGRDRGRGR